MLLAGMWPFACFAAASIDPAPRPAATSFSPALVQQGAALAAIGGCVGCHTSPGGAAYAGGRALQTPFGTVYGSNITPDADTGIGKWSAAAFRRAMHEGVDREGRNLYPVFPYDHFRHVTDADVDALYAFLMTRQAVVARPPPNALRFPYDNRALISAWKALYLRDDPPPGIDDGSPEWRRGAYLVEGLGHCGACHTARNALGGEQRGAPLGGGDADGWDAHALDASSPAPLAWTADELVTYLRGGLPERHDVAAGPMASVAHDLAAASDSDVRSIAIYLASLSKAAPHASVAPDAPTTARTAMTGGTLAPASGDSGAAIYAGACGSCHGPGRGAPRKGALRLRDSTAVSGATPRNVIRIVMRGIVPADGEQGAWMPSFAGAFTESQITDLVVYLRARFSAQSAWHDVAREVRQISASSTD